jgi:bifunctional UDP-N-acetylglucosamine pyrophosphorylase/glucosamine-1-phosphate N-acetyltransferase
MAETGRMAALILAAGEGTRMKSGLAKVLHTVGGKTMIRRVIETVQRTEPERIIVVVGHQADMVKKELDGEDVEFVLQSERLGTGHAAQMAKPLLGSFDGTIQVLNGDVPLLSVDTLSAFSRYHHDESSRGTVLTAVIDAPEGYGRIVRDPEGRFLRIVEDKDASDEEKRIREINSGIFCFEAPDLFSALGCIDRRNVQGEYYITDCMEILRREGKHVAAYRCERNEEVLGINNTEQLAAAERLLKADG